MSHRLPHQFDQGDCYPDDETIIQRILVEWMGMHIAPPAGHQRALAQSALRVILKELGR